MLRRLTTRCDGCGRTFSVVYAEGTRPEVLREAAETVHKLQSRFCLAGPRQRHKVSDECDAPAGGARPDTL